MKLLQVLVFLFSVQMAHLEARSFPQHEKCEGWQVLEQTNDYEIVEHRHADGACQTIQITNHGNIYFLLPGPYGYDQYLLNQPLPKNFPRRYRKRCCWLRKTKDGSKLVMSYQVEEPELLFEPSV